MRLPWQERAEQARRDRVATERMLAAVRAQRPKVEAAARQIREGYERNHFAEGIEATFARRRRHP